MLFFHRQRLYPYGANRKERDSFGGLQKDVHAQVLWSERAEEQGTIMHDHIKERIKIRDIPFE